MSPYHMVTERPVRKLSKGSKGTHMHIVDCGGSGGGVVSVCGVYVSLSVCIYMFFFSYVVVVATTKYGRWSVGGS